MVLPSFVKPFVNQYKERVASWHYFIEPCPKEGPKPVDPKIRLRFYGQATKIDDIRTYLNTRLLTLIKQVESPVTFHHDQLDRTLLWCLLYILQQNHISCHQLRRYKKRGRYCSRHVWLQLVLVFVGQSTTFIGWPQHTRVPAPDSKIFTLFPQISQTYTSPIVVICSPPLDFKCVFYDLFKRTHFWFCLNKGWEFSTQTNTLRR
jgi:hypothetical protein